MCHVLTFVCGSFLHFLQLIFKKQGLLSLDLSVFVQFLCMHLTIINWVCHHRLVVLEVLLYSLLLLSLDLDLLDDTIANHQMFDSKLECQFENILSDNLFVFIVKFVLFWYRRLNFRWSRLLCRVFLCLMLVGLNLHQGLILCCGRGL